MMALAVTVVVLLGVPMAVVIQRLAMRDTYLALERDAASAGLVVSVDGVSGTDPIELPELASGVLLSVYSAGGRRVAGAGPDSADLAVSGALRAVPTQSQVDGNPVVALPLTSDEQLYGAIRAQAPNGAVPSRARPYWLVLAGLAVGSFLISALLANILGRRLARPIQRIAAATTALGAGSFDVDIESAGIGEIDDAADALRAAARRLGDVIERERAFSARVSHQLRTPLAGLYLDIEQSAMPADQRTKALEHIERLGATIDDLVRLSRHAAPAGSVSLLATAFDQVEQRWHGPLAARGRPLRTKADDGIENIPMSEAALRQILDVLVQNALEHGSGPVEIVAHGIAGGVVVEVSDGGPSSEGSSAGLASGRGIGLPLARSLAETEGARLLGGSHSGGTTYRLIVAVPDAPGPG
jgi:signal transduction histidine kinase